MGLLASRMLFAPPSTSGITHNPQNSSNRREKWAEVDRYRLLRSLAVWLRLIFGGRKLDDGLIERMGDSSDSSDDEAPGGSETSEH